MIDFTVLVKAIDHYGQDAQILKAVEECNELATSLMHYRSGKVEKEAVVQEIADVLVVANQLRLIFGPKETELAIEAKVERLASRMEN